MLRTFGILAYVGLGLFVPNIALAAPVTAKKDTQVTAEPKKGAAVLKELKKGDSIEAADRAGMFWKVTVDGKEGYVSVMSVQRAAGEATGIQSALANAAKEARDSGSDAGQSTRARSAVMGVRGLDENSSMAEVGNLRPDLKAVYRMEDRATSLKRVNRLESLVFKEVENTMEATAK